MLNKLKGFLGLLIIVGCVMIWLSFFPLESLKTYSGILEHYGWLSVKLGVLVLFIVLVLHGINEYLYRFKREPSHVIWKSKRVTRMVIALSVFSLLVTGLGWWLSRPYVLTRDALPLTEVLNHPERYRGKEISVVGYFYYYGFPHPLWDGCVALGKTSAGEFDVLRGIYLPVKLPPEVTRIRNEGKYVFTGILKIEYIPFAKPMPVLEVSSVVEI